VGAQRPTGRSSVADRPAVNALVLVHCGDCGSAHHSRVEDVVDEVVVISAPHELVSADGTHRFLLSWGTTKGKHSLPMVVVGSSNAALPKWRLRPSGQVETVQIRDYVRVDVTGAVDLQPTERPTDPGISGRGNLDNLSENGLRCHTDTGLLREGEGVRAVVDLSGEHVTRTGQVLRVAPFTRTLDVVVIQFDADTVLEDKMRAYVMARLIERRRLEAR